MLRMSNSLVIRIDCGSIFPDCYQDLSDYFKLVSERWFWGFHDKESNPHFHWLICTDRTDNLIRQEIRKRLHTKGNGAYQCKKLKDLDAYGSYVCFKDHTRGYETYGFPDEQVASWRQRGLDILEKKEEKQERVTKSPASDPLALLFKEVGRYDWSENHDYNARKFLLWLRRHKSVGMYGRDRLIFRAWRDSTIYIMQYEDDDDGNSTDPDYKKRYADAIRRIEAYEKTRIDELR